MISKRAVDKKSEDLTWIDIEKQIGFLLRKASQRNLIIFQKHVPIPNLTSVQAAALIVLIDHSPCSLTTLGRRAAMDPATTRGVAERLSDRGWVSLVSDESDKRKVMVKLERKGRKLANELVPLLHAIADATLKPLNEEERVALTLLLERISQTDAEDHQASLHDMRGMRRATGGRPASGLPAGRRNVVMPR